MDAKKDMPESPKTIAGRHATMSGLGGSPHPTGGYKTHESNACDAGAVKGAKTYEKK